MRHNHWASASFTHVNECEQMTPRNFLDYNLISIPDIEVNWAQVKVSRLSSPRRVRYLDNEAPRDVKWVGPACDGKAWAASQRPKARHNPC